MCFAERSGFGLNALLGRGSPITPSTHGPPDCGATNPAPEPADCESLAHGERCSCANGEANQHERGYDAPDREASLFGLPLATQLSLDAQIRLKNGLRDCFGLLLLHVPAFLISGLTPELSRAAKRRRLGRTVRRQPLALGRYPRRHHATP